MKKSFILVVFIGFMMAGVCRADDSYSAFFRAVPLDDRSDVAALLARGFDPNAVDADGNSALMLALRAGALHVADLLLDQPGLDVDHCNAHGENALMYASLQGQLGIARRLIADGAAVDKSGWTPLAYAATTGQLELARLLLDHGARADAPAPNGSTPMMLAAYFDHPDLIQLLLDHGADPTLRNSFGYSAADLARQRGYVDLARAIDALSRPEPEAPAH